MSYKNFPVHLVGGRICLDFLNTANWTSNCNVAVERLTTTEDLDIWKQAVGLINHTILDDEELHGHVLEFRKTLRQIFLSSIDNKKPSSTDTASLNKVLVLSGPSKMISGIEGGLIFDPAFPITKLLASSAVSILTSPNEIKRVKMCPSKDCGWVFLDESRNGRRTWCSMELCGNRAKAKRHYARRTNKNSHP